MKKKNLGFTLAEVLIVIGIIGVVAALTLPNLNHATGDKEIVTRLQKAYSILNEANDRAVAIYGPISTWKSNEQCGNNLEVCYMHRIKEFLKVSKYCDVSSAAADAGTSIDCEEAGFVGDDNDINYYDVFYQLPDGITFTGSHSSDDCTNTIGSSGSWRYIKDYCYDIYLDINGANKGKNKTGQDIFHFIISDSLGVIAYSDGAETIEDSVNNCMASKSADECTWWVIEYGNLDYLKADGEGKCNDSNIILDGVTNTSCH